MSQKTTCLSRKTIIPKKPLGKGHKKSYIPLGEAEPGPTGSSMYCVKGESEKALHGSGNLRDRPRERPISQGVRISRRRRRSRQHCQQLGDLLRVAGGVEPCAMADCKNHAQWQIAPASKRFAKASVESWREIKRDVHEGAILLEVSFREANRELRVPRIYEPLE